MYLLFKPLLGWIVFLQMKWGQALYDEQAHVLRSLLALSYLHCSFMLAEDVFVRRHSYSSVFADLTNLKHFHTSRTGWWWRWHRCNRCQCFDTSRLGLWLSVWSSSWLFYYLALSCLVLNYFLMSYLNLNITNNNPSIAEHLKGHQQDKE